MGHGERLILGTADYLAPEQALNSSAVDTRADLYALGGTLYFLLAGHPPFPDGSPMEKVTRKLTADPPPIEPAAAGRAAGPGRGRPQAAGPRPGRPVSAPRWRRRWR